MIRKARFILLGSLITALVFILGGYAVANFFALREESIEASVFTEFYLGEDGAVEISAAIEDATSQAWLKSGAYSLKAVDKDGNELDGMVETDGGKVWAVGVGSYDLLITANFDKTVTARIPVTAVFRDEGLRQAVSDYGILNRDALNGIRELAVDASSVDLSELAYLGGLKELRLTRESGTVALQGTDALSDDTAVFVPAEKYNEYNTSEIFSNIFPDMSQANGEFVIAFDLAGGTVEGRTVYGGSFFVKRSGGAFTDIADFTPSFAGYNFLGWRAAGGGDYLTAQSLLSAHTKLTAVWGEKAYKLCFDCCGGEAVGDMDAVFGEQVVLPSPVRCGYTFDCWKLPDGSTIESGGVPDLGEHNAVITLTAEWSPRSYRLFYDTNAPASASGTVEGNMGISVYRYDVSGMLATNDYSLTGWSFTGWNTRPDGSGTQYQDRQFVVNVPPDEAFDAVEGMVSFTLYAQWSAQSFTVTYDYQGASEGCDILAAEVYYDSVYTLETPQKSGYAFAGWFSEAEGGGVRYTDAGGAALADWTETAGRTLYAKWTATLLFEYEGATSGNTAENISVTFGVPVGKLPTPDKTGSVFGGWYGLPGGAGTRYTDSTEYREDAAGPLYAKWTTTLNLDYQGATGGITALTLQVVYNAVIEGLPSPTLTGYAFAGWYTMSGGRGEKYDSDTLFRLGANSTLYAHWAAKDFIITYEYEGATGGNSAASAEVAYDAPYRLAIPVRAGYTFAGWYGEAGGAGLRYTEAEGKSVADWTETAGRTLYAKWTATLRFEYEGATGGNAMSDKEAVYAAPTGNLPAPSKTGNTFGGWFTGRGGTGELYQSARKYLADGDTTLYAKWTTSVEFDYQGATDGITVDSVAAVYYAELGSLPEPIRTNYEFGGWFDTVGGKGNKYTALSLYDKHTVSKLYAKWTTVISFNDNGADAGSMAWSEQSVVYNAEVGRLPTPKKAGQTFSAWIDEFGNAVTADTIFLLSGNNTLSAVWITALMFDYQGANEETVGPEHIGVTGGSPIGPGGLPSPAPARTGWTFGGWWTEIGGGGTEYKPATVAPALSTMLYAKWSVTVVLEYEGADGGNGTASLPVVYNAPVTGLPVPSKTGNTFEGWFTAEGGAGTQVQEGDLYLYGFSLYAKWKTTVTFDYQGADGGSDTLTVEAVYKTPVGALPEPTKEGNVFGGWSLGAGDLSGVISEETVYSLHTPATLYAIWLNTLSFEYEGATGNSSVESKTLVFNAAFGDLPEPVKTGYRFGGWFTERAGAGTLYDSDSVYTGTAALTLYAKWTANTYAVRYDANKPANSSAAVTGEMSDTPYTYDKSAVLDANAYSLANWKFQGWNTAADGSGSHYANRMFVANLTAFHNGIVVLYAQWKPDSYTLTLEPDGGTVQPGFVLVDYDGGFNLPVPVRSGYKFGGWYGARDGGGTEYTNTSGASVAPWTEPSSKTLYAKWNYSVSYYLNKPSNASATFPGNMLGSEHTYNVEKALSANIYTLTGWTFSGWNTAANGSGTAYADKQSVLNLATNSSGNVILYAQWTAMKTTVTFNANGGTGGPSPTVMTYDSALPAINSVPTRSKGDSDSAKSEWVFAGYFDVESGTRYYAANRSALKNWDKVGGEITLFARWVQATVSPGNVTVGEGQASSNNAVTVTVSVSGGSGRYTYSAESSGNSNFNFSGPANTNQFKIWRIKDAESTNGCLTITVTDTAYGISATTVVAVTTKKTSGCVQEGTFITLADGSAKKVEDVTYDDLLLVWNFETGAFDVSQIIHIYSRDAELVPVIEMNFSDGSVLNIVHEHSMYDMTLSKFMQIDTDNVYSFIDHSFQKLRVDAEGHAVSDSVGNFIYDVVQLVSAEVRIEYTRVYSMITAVQYNNYFNGLLCIASELLGFANAFEINKTCIYDAAAKERDIAFYGLFTYDDFKKCLTVEEYQAFNAEILKVSIGKGLVTMDEVLYWIETYL